jgi:RNA polymerase sigma-70 factor (ECF subfamily)
MEYLPEVQRQTLILYSEEEMSYHEIAVAMETNIGTVKSRLFQARKALRRLMRPQTLKALAAELNEEDNL